MKPRSHPRLAYLFTVSFGTTMLDLFFFLVHNFDYSCFLFPLIPRSRFAIYHIFRSYCPRFVCSDDP